MCLEFQIFSGLMVNFFCVILLGHTPTVNIFGAYCLVACICGPSFDAFMAEVGRFVRGRYACLRDIKNIFANASSSA